MLMVISIVIRIVIVVVIIIVLITSVTMTATTAIIVGFNTIVLIVMYCCGHCYHSSFLP